MLQRLKPWLAATVVILAGNAAVAQRVGPAVGQRIAFDLTETNALASWEARRWTVEDGLPQNTVTSLAQTPDGYLWIGTFGGLVRFDGSRFEVFDLTTTPELWSNRINALCTDARGRLWIAAGDLIIYEEGSFRSAGRSWDARHRDVRALAADSNGHVWIGGLGVARDTGSGVGAHAGTQSGRSIRALFPLGDDVWAAPWNVAELVSLREEREPARFDDLVEQALTAGEYATGSTPVHEAFDPGGSVVESIPAVESMCRGRLGNVWVAAGDSLFAAVRDPAAKDRGWTYRRVLELEVGIRCVFEDREGNVWVGSEGRGLIRLERKPFLLIDAEDLPVQPTYLISARRDGGWWLSQAVNSNHIWVFQNGAFTRGYETQGGRRKDLIEDGTGALWVAHGPRIWRFEEAPPLMFDVGEPMDALAEGRGGVIWCAGVDTVLRLDEQGLQQQIRSERELAIGPILSLSEAPDGALWLAGVEGVARLRDGSLDRLTSPEGGLRGPVRAIHHDAQGGTWFGTYGGGLTRFKDGVFTSCTMDDGLPDNAICDIQKDSRGTLWVNSNRGAFTLDEGHLVDFAEGKVSRITARLLGTPEGDGRSGAISAEGRICFPTIAGLVLLDPDRIDAQLRPLPVLIEGLSTDASEHGVATEDVVVLPLGQRALHFEFTSPRLAGTDKLHYRFRLLGYEDEWVEGGPRGSASFRRVPHGRYRFEVIAVDGAGAMSEPPTSLDVELPAHFHEALWFRGAGVLALLALGGYLVLRAARAREANRRDLARQRALAEDGERRRIARELHDDFGQRLASVAIDMAVAGKRGAPGSNLTDLSARIRGVAEDLHSLSRTIHPSILEDLGLQRALESDGEDFSQRTGIDVECDAGPMGQEPAQDIAICAVRLFHECLRNIQEHACATSARVLLRSDGEHLSLSVQDNGRGFDPAAARGEPGIGLRSMRERVESLGGRLTVSSRPDEGTRIDARLPLQGNPADR
jgi:signal transduction histidine kinase/ligand-binding sensor domain-containing protein